ncbi:hypothetical protein CC2G_004341 [Coprinopsis cinerea AmutBmut pab1-1]|nr:hypothetical protein CC2G_004341 [Coprinopsis cinerea AmutBmut pab1-1]
MRLTDTGLVDGEPAKKKRKRKQETDPWKENVMSFRLDPPTVNSPRLGLSTAPVLETPVRQPLSPRAVNGNASSAFGTSAFGSFIAPGNYEQLPQPPPQSQYEIEAAHTLLGLGNTAGYTPNAFESPQSTSRPLDVDMTCAPTLERPRPAEHHSATHVQPKRAYRRGYKAKAVEEALDRLRQDKISPLEMLLMVLNPENMAFEAHRTKFFDSRNQTKILSLFEYVRTNKHTKELFESWLKPIALGYVCEWVDDEMEAAKPEMRMYTNQIDVEYAQNWDLFEIMEPVSRLTPVWTRILTCATSPKAAGANRVEDDEMGDEDDSNRHRPIARHLISSQVHYTRSRHSAKVAMALGISAWTMGCSKETTGMLHRAGLSLGYTTIESIIETLGDRSVESASEAADGPHAFCYDNVQTSSSVFVEQTLDTKAKVKSGTLCVIYPLPNADPKHLQLDSLLERQRNAHPLELHDLRPSPESRRAFIHQTNIHILRVLSTYIPGFARYEKEEVLQHQPRKPCPTGVKTDYYPLRLSTIEEASVKGNRLVHEDAYITQLQKDPKELSKHAVPSCNDQLTNARIRSLQLLRKLDIDAFERRSFLVPELAPFHTSLNATWVLKTAHYGSIKDEDSLSFFFNLLGKRRLAGNKPDYHTLQAACNQILDGILLAAWETECGDLYAFSKTEPAPEKLLEIANTIRQKYATPTFDFPAANTRQQAPPADDSNVDDPVHENTIRLTRDLLLLREFDKAVKDGDVGRMEDTLTDLALLFRGAGSVNYANELLHFIHNVKAVWSPEFADIMRYMLVVNTTGLEGRFIGTDKNIEYLIRYVKKVFSSKGVLGHWERGGKISAAIKNLMALKRCSTRSLKVNYQGSTHTQVDTRAVVFKMAANTKQAELLKKVPGRKGKLRPDLCVLGRRKMETSGVTNFNKKLEAMRDGVPFVAEEDEIEGPDFSETPLDHQSIEELMDAL